MTTLNKDKKQYKAPHLTTIPMAPHCMFTASESETEIEITYDPENPAEEYD